MKNKGALLSLLTLAGFLLLANVRLTLAQQPIKENSGNTSSDVKCRLPVTVIGAVHNPVRFELQRRLRLIEAIALAGGLSEKYGGTIRIEHSAAAATCAKSISHDSPARVESFELYRLDDVLGDKANPYLNPGDMINVSEAERVLVTGNVTRPQIVLLRNSLTLTQALALAGGTLTGSKKERVTITRRAFGAKEQTVTTVNLNAIEKRRAQDITLQPGDIVYVPGKKSSGCCAGVHVLIVILSATEPTTRIIY